MLVTLCCRWSRSRTVTSPEEDGLVTVISVRLEGGVRLLVHERIGRLKRAGSRQGKIFAELRRPNLRSEPECQNSFLLPLQVGPRKNRDARSARTIERCRAHARLILEACSHDVHFAVQGSSRRRVCPFQGCFCFTQTWNN